MKRRRSKSESRCKQKEEDSNSGGSPEKENSPENGCSMGAVRDFHEEMRTVQKSVSAHFLQQKELAESVGLVFKQKENVQGQVGLAVAAAAAAHPEEKKQLGEYAGVSSTTVNKYTRVLTSPGSGKVSDMVRSPGRPKTYSLEAEKEFVEWAEDSNVPANQKTMQGMIEKFRDILTKDIPFPTGEEYSDEGIRQEIYRIGKKRVWKMLKPVTVELKRCGIRKRLVRWFKRKDVREALMVNPHLLFNADETEISRKIAQVEKILWLDETRKPAVPGKDRSGSHLT